MPQSHPYAGAAVPSFSSVRVLIRFSKINRTKGFGLVSPENEAVDVVIPHISILFRWAFSPSGDRSKKDIVRFR
jgi:hypothetical protein